MESGRKSTKLVIKNNDVGRAALMYIGASPDLHQFIIGIDEAGRPDFWSGRASPRHSHKYIIGIDEAGRGPLAGPVVVAGIRIKTKGERLNIKVFKGIKDSKKLSAKRREEWFAVLMHYPNITWAVARVWPRVIDRINISRATNLGAWRVYRKLCSDRRIERNRALLDGGLRLPTHIPHKAIIKGDEKIPLISAASIIAKVMRDRIMIRLHKKYPQYRFDLHKGYGTKLHCGLLKKFGRSRSHRRSFRICQN